ncbi:HlyD family type I secretion periplasmic adaptor subunit [Hyphomicrobium sp. CS1BSMeth3]|uniref:HlyD family type I secretion periplasmic adaptor subunit n=1 Tax=Hyphomicrobium sp. CS1BSMeth3 TaxID=1892844 RepID=UPI000930014E|nr:HlyD family type I secretion periplasmic adaptor subunit [Hyphomicrobium sp. CS1BSMeth3]
MSNCPSIDQWHKGVPTDSRGPIRIGAAILLLCLGGFSVWAAVAPLEGAVVVSGSFMATGQNKQVQHLEGGIVRDVLVREGQLVEAGQPLLRLDPTAAEARLRRLVLRQHRLVILKARLEAEAKGAAHFALPTNGDFVDEAGEVATIYARQLIELKARRTKITDEEAVLRREIAGLHESISGYQAQAAATEERIALFAQELKDKSTLLERELVRRTEILALRRAEAGLSGELASLQARAADARERVSRAEQQIAHLRSAALQKSLEDLRATETELDDVNEQLRAARDVMDRIEIRAPVAGIVVRLMHNTKGGVVAAGAVVLELLPVDDELIIEARLNPNEVVHVKEGLGAMVRLSALNQRLTPMIEGKVVYLSADTVSQREPFGAKEAARRDTFVVRVQLDEASARSKIESFRPTPGMPADVFIKTDERTFLEYILKPLSDTFVRAFREQ